MAHHGDFGNLVGTLERVDIGAVLGTETDVGSMLGEQKRRIGGHRRRRRYDRLEGLVFNHDGVDGIDGGALRRRDDRSDDVAHETHSIGGKDRAVQRRRHHGETLKRRQTKVVATVVVHAHHTGHCLGLRHVDTRDLAVRDRRTNERHVQHALWGHVIEVFPATGKQGGVFQTADAISQDRTCCHGFLLSLKLVMRGMRTCSDGEFATGQTLRHGAVRHLNC